MKAMPFDVFGCIWGMLMSLVAAPCDTWKTIFVEMHVTHNFCL